MIDYQYIKICWKKIKAEKGSDAFVDHFYHLLFTNYPETQELFPNDLVTQKRTLLTTIDNIINGIEHVQKIKTALLTLGKHHKHLGVTPEMYDAFIVAIVEAADFASNASLTEDERHTWEKAYREMADIMLEAY